jgi:hypothetical protein
MQIAKKLIHLPGKLAGAYKQSRISSSLVKHVHLPDKRAGVSVRLDAQIASPATTRRAPTATILVMLKRLAYYLLILPLGCSDPQPAAQTYLDSSTAHIKTQAPVPRKMRTIVTPDDLDNMLSTRHAVVFVDVDWSVQSVLARRRVCEFIEAWNRESPESTVAFFRLDVTEQEGEFWSAVRNWSRQQSVSGFMSAGAGSLIWLSSGKVEHSLLNARAVKTPELIETTHKTFNETSAARPIAKGH